MMALAVNYLMGRRDRPRCLKFSILDLAVETREVRPRANCPTCSPVALPAVILEEAAWDCAEEIRALAREALHRIG